MVQIINYILILMLLLSRCEKLEIYDLITAIAEANKGCGKPAVYSPSIKSIPLMECVVSFVAKESVNFVLYRCYKTEVYLIQQQLV